MIFWAIFLRHFAFNDLITPWSISCVVHVVLGGKKNYLIDFKFLIWKCAGQLSTASVTLLPSNENYWSNSHIHSSNSTPFLQLFIWCRYRQGKNFTFLKQDGFWDFLITNLVSYPQKHPLLLCQLCELTFHSEHFSDLSWHVLFVMLL